MSTTTRPFVVSTTNLLSSLMSVLRPARASVVDESHCNRPAGNGAAEPARDGKRRTALQHVRHRALIGRLDLVRQRVGRVGEAGLADDVSAPIEAEQDGNLGPRPRLLKWWRHPASPHRMEQLLQRIERHARRGRRLFARLDGHAKAVAERIRQCRLTRMLVEHAAHGSRAAGRGHHQQAGGDRRRNVDDDGRAHFGSAATCMRTMRSGLLTAPFCVGDPFLILSTTSMPETTSPTTVYWPLRLGVSSNMMKNWLLAELGFCARAIPTMPRLNGTLENSAGKSGYFEPPVPSPRWPSPVCAMNPGMTRWNGTLSWNFSRASVLMRSACLGARSGLSLITTRPYCVSR